ncbi:TetR/AcrR family transcriptional regulator [Kineococcus radiotolerans]|uniref:Transcriptional regulator, TetR family n=1 Tax=Kineococcus radiotolerans (strain ATCC BAA-149 / DSM 14245 / SRS30216) TaxID=266940 RepID=A6WBM5_KINRD|nr:TetR/AcrR family transcriptional regulator [Kineococcus radiotolerans]ABS04214.1 transcriptional regulator, TetR family [Kineococcus radiotolerans SRS30216 = ATCC BAA-149]
MPTTDTSRSRAGRGEYAKSALRRREILDAALTVFAASGYRNASLREIADRIGISQQGLTYHFPTKDVLLAAVLQARGERDRALFDVDEAGPESHLRTLLQLLGSNQATPGLVELHCTLSAEATSPDHPAHAYFQERYAGIVGRTAQVFAELRARGRLREGVDPERCARGLVALMDGLQVQWLLSGKRIDMVADVRAHLTSVTTLDLS